MNLIKLFWQQFQAEYKGPKTKMKNSILSFKWLQSPLMVMYMYSDWSTDTGPAFI